MERIKNKFNLIYSVTILLISLILIGVLMLELGKNTLSVHYINIYLAAGIVGSLGFGLFILFDFVKNQRKGNVTSKLVFVSEDDSKKRFLSVVKLIIPLLLIITVVFIQLGVKSQVIPMPMPYDVQNGMSVDQALSAQSMGANILWVGVYPGLFEEMVIFVIVTCIVGLLTLFEWLVFKVKNALQNPVLLLINTPIACAIGSFLFTFAHTKAYGLDKGLYLSAWFFEFIVQMFNQFTGMFSSWLPHMVHNSLIITGLLVGISIGGYVLAGGVFVIPKKLYKKINNWR